MTTRILVPVLCATLLAASACTSVDEITLTQAEADTLASRFETTVDTQQKLTEFMTAASRGDLDITGYDYVAPTADNGWIGSLTIPNGVFPFGTGDLTLTFQTMGDGVPVDPYVTDLRTAGVVDIDAQIDFLGTTPLGLDLSAQSDLAITTLQNSAETMSTQIDGTWDILVDGYDSHLDATDLQLDFDMVAADVTNVVGQVAGTVDIPDFAADADFLLTGLGNQVDVAVDVLTSTLHWTFDLLSL